MEITSENFDSVFEAFGRFHMAKRQANLASKRFDSAAAGLSAIRKSMQHLILSDDDLLAAGKLVARKRRADHENIMAHGAMSAIKNALLR